MKKIFITLSIAFIALSVVAQTAKTTKTVVKKTTSTKPKPKVKTAVTKTISNTNTKPEKMDTSTYVLISTEFGDIKIRLYDETPLHKANFIKLVKEGTLDSTLFHRIIPEFMIQGGDPTSKNALPGQPLGSGDVGYRVPAEFNKNLFHKRGVLAAARDGNPAKASSGCQFYITQGKKYTRAELQMLASRTGNSWTEEQMKIYEETGGTPMLDMGYTVFGEVVSGMDTVDKIITQPRDGRDRPNTDIRMRVTLAE
jgi:cyclophilin family peptidyl-prolyl cis-trans isomerase